MLCCDGCKGKINSGDIVTKTQNVKCDIFGTLTREGPEKIYCSKCMKEK